MAYFDKTEYGKYMSIQNVSGSGDPESAPAGGVYLFASGTAGSAKLYLQNEGVSTPLSLADGGTLQMAGDSGTDTVSMATDTLTFAGGDGLTSAVTDNQVEFSLNVNSTSFQIASDEIQLASGVAGEGLTLSSDVLAVSMQEFGGGDGVDVANDQIVFIDASDSNGNKRDSVADFMTAVAGDGLVASSGQLELNVPDMATEMTGDVADTDEFAISDGGTMKKVDFSVVRDAVFADVSGDATVAAGGALTLGADVVDGSNIADDSIDSEHIALGALDSEHYASGSIEGGHIGNDQIDSQHYAAGSIDNEHLAADSVNGDKIADDSIDSEHIALGALDSEHYASGSIESGHLAGSVANAKLANSSVTVTAGDGLKDGGEVALGASVTLNIEPADFAGSGLEDDGSDNLRIAAAAAGDGLTGGAGSALALDIDGMATAMTGDLEDTDEFAISDGGTMKKVDFSVVRDAVFADVSGDATVAAGGALTLGADVVDGSNIADDSIDSEHIVLGALDAEHYSSGSIENGHLAGAIANAKLVNDSVTLTAGAGMATIGEVELGASITVAVDGVLEDLDTLGAASADGEFIVATGAGTFAYESGDTARTSLGLGTGDSPAFASLEVSDLTQGRIVLAGASGELEDSASLRFASGLLDVTASAGISLNGSVNFANGYQFNTDYGMSFNSLDGTLIARGQVSADSGLNAGGGYGGGSGASLSSAGNLSMNGDLVVDGTGRVDGAFQVGVNGIGANATFYGAASNEMMQWNADANRLSFKDSSDATMLTIGGDASSEFAIDVANGSDNINKIRAAAFVTYSDESLKTEVQTMNTALDAVMSLNGVEFTWKDSGERDFGFIAQEVAAVLPKAVHTNEGVSGVDYSRLTSVLVEAVKAQQVQIEELKAILKK